MQLSLPNPLAADTALASAVPVLAGVMPAPTCAGTPATGAAFETFMPTGAAPAGKTPPTGEAGEAEQAASALAASLWLPVMTPVPPAVVPVAVVPGTPSLGEGTSDNEPATETTATNRDAVPVTAGRNGVGQEGGQTESSTNPAMGTVRRRSVRAFGQMAPARPAGTVPLGPPEVSLGLSSSKQISSTPDDSDAGGAAVSTGPGKVSRPKVAARTGLPASLAPDASLPAAVPVVLPAGQQEAAVTAVTAPMPVTTEAPATAATFATVSQPQTSAGRIAAGSVAPKRPAQPVASISAGSPETRVDARAVPAVSTPPPAAVPAEDAGAAPLIEGKTLLTLPPRDQVAPLPEKIADLQTDFPVYATSELPADKKEILNTGLKAVTAAPPVVGISVAQVAASMSASTTNRPKSASAAWSVPVDSAPVPSGAAAVASFEVPVVVATPRETMAAVVHAVETLERHADVPAKSVELKFQVGGEKLDLRVELKDGVVHTTFRTESPELRAALAQEWRVSVPAETGVAMRLAAPVFNAPSTGGDATAGFAGQGAPQHRSPQDREPTAFTLAHDFSDTGSPESAPAVAAVIRPVSILNAFA